MADSKASKKSETIEIRLSYETKTAFMERCRLERRTASDAIRLFIDEQLDARSRARRRLRAWRIAAAAAVGAALGLGVAAPSFAHATGNSKTAFERLDRNHDGVLTYEEFRSR
jgi:ferric-dicitrate binding protein FerR (iron transport regulator)